MPAGLPVEVIAKVVLPSTAVFIHGTYHGGRLVLPPNTTLQCRSVRSYDGHIGPSAIVVNALVNSVRGHFVPLKKTN